ncbi:hypothetical protein NEIFLAOT_02409 [Neisseria flavescens NRL30031/H210]|uniref:Uncharacterized protein n=1 Tax=Neisseria flavescens NRL30031/H210 TaxID=546264 RepID=C0ER10_NEIFL|nr:hypothetical protein NEIFLAOT_02409 [Neisseria flavescens NRL30031/H210]
MPSERVCSFQTALLPRLDYFQRRSGWFSKLSIIILMMRGAVLSKSKFSPEESQRLFVTVNPVRIDGISRIVVNGLAVLVNDGRSRRGVDGHGFVDGGLRVDGQVQDGGAPIRSLGIDARAQQEGDAQCQCLHVSDGLI